MIEKLVVKPLDRDVCKAIDGRREDRAAVIFEMLRKVASAAEKTDANGCLSDDHLDSHPW